MRAAPAPTFYFFAPPPLLRGGLKEGGLFLWMGPKFGSNVRPIIIRLYLLVSFCFTMTFLFGPHNSTDLKKKKKLEVHIPFVWISQFKMFIPLCVSKRFF